MIFAAGVSRGVAISKAKILKRKANDIKKYNMESDSEIARLDFCIRAANDELKVLHHEMTSSRDDPAAAVLGKYMNIINNRQLLNDIKEMIISDGVSAEYAISSILDSSRKQLQKLDDEYLSQKYEDIDEIKSRLLSKLKSTEHAEINDIREECILVADDLKPGDVLSMNPHIVKGFVTLWGCPASSTAIMARRMNIPAVTGIGHEGYCIKEGDLLIVDGNRGKVIINPDERILKSYRA